MHIYVGLGVSAYLSSSMVAAASFLLRRLNCDKNQLPSFNLIWLPASLEPKTQNYIVFVLLKWKPLHLGLSLA